MVKARTTYTRSMGETRFLEEHSAENRFTRETTKEEGKIAGGESRMPIALVTEEVHSS